MKSSKENSYSRVKFHCDWEGRCRLPPFVEVYPMKELINKNNIEFAGSWSYLCLIHYAIAKLRKDRIAVYRLGFKDYLEAFKDYVSR